MISSTVQELQSLVSQRGGKATGKVAKTMFTAGLVFLSLRYGLGMSNQMSKRLLKGLALGSTLVPASLVPAGISLIQRKAKQRLLQPAIDKAKQTIISHMDILKVAAEDTVEDMRKKMLEKLALKGVI